MFKLLFSFYSYGDETTSKFKYKTFLTNGNSRSVNQNSNSDDSIELKGYSSSALYSQTYRGSSSQKFFTYYLNAYIESEEDEGVYQCINPNWPNFIIQNITVLISSKYIEYSNIIKITGK